MPGRGSSPVDGLPRMTAAEAARLAGDEYARFGALLETLAPHEWVRPTVCEPWDVRLMVAHVVGATEANASPPEMLRQLRRGRRGFAIEVDPVSAAQVDRRARLTPAELVGRFGAAVPAALAWRARWCRFAGWVPLRVGAPLHETWRVRYLMETIYTRDVWMHRIDVCHATGRGPELSAEHDGRIVADVVGDWALRHGRPFTLVLAGPAGGRFECGAGGPRLESDAVEFCRVLSGRGTGAGLLATPVPF